MNGRKSSYLCKPQVKNGILSLQLQDPLLFALKTPQTRQISMVVGWSVKECVRAVRRTFFFGEDNGTGLLISHLILLSERQPSSAWWWTHPQLVLQQVDLVGKNLVPV